MNGFDLWLAPLLLLPGIGLLIMSTSSRFGHLQGQIIAITTDGSLATLKLAQSLRFRGQLFRFALLMLYVSATAFIVASTVNGINGLLPVQVPIEAVVVVTVGGFVARFASLAAMFIESFSADDVLEAYHDSLFADRQLGE